MTFENVACHTTNYSYEEHSGISGNSFKCDDLNKVIIVHCRVSADIPFSSVPLSAQSLCVLVWWLSVHLIIRH